MRIDYERFARILLRCKEVSEEPEINVVVKHVYSDALKEAAEAFLVADTQVKEATIAFEKIDAQALKALANLDTPYRVTRSALRALLPETTKTLPATLKSLPTDTDQLKGIALMLDILQKHTGKSWADALLAGEFGDQGPAAVKVINEAIAANKVLATAQTNRASAYGPANEKYLSFKHVVRDAQGSTSKQYRRIHLRASSGTKAEDSATEAAPPKPTPAPTQVATQVATPAAQMDSLLDVLPAARPDVPRTAPPTVVDAGSPAAP